jgi:peptide/nickel transport system permease protein
LLVITIVAVLGPGLQNVIVALGLSGWVTFARMARTQALQLKAREFVATARAIGCGDRRILLRHILPSALSPLIVLASFAVAQMIILEAALSFLGLGVPPTTPTWGGMLADSRDYLALAWWLATFPGLVLMLTVLAVNLLGDWLRDVLDPRAKL